MRDFSDLTCFNCSNYICKAEYLLSSVFYTFKVILSYSVHLQNCHPRIVCLCQLKAKFTSYHSCVLVLNNSKKSIFSEVPERSHSEEQKGLTVSSVFKLENQLSSSFSCKFLNIRPAGM